MIDENDGGMREKICPFLSTGDLLLPCQGRDCAAFRRVYLADRSVCVCALIDREFADCWEGPGYYGD